MVGSITLGRIGTTAFVTLANPGKRNAIDIAMWHELRAVFERLQVLPADGAPRSIVVRGADRTFASGGDIAEFANFRFDKARLHDFHENTVAPALNAMLDCEIPVLALIEGDCIGGGFEIAACCDIRVCGIASRFGAPIAKLGFPMAPRELALLSTVVPASMLRSMLLEARLIGSEEAQRFGVVDAVVGDDQVAAAIQQRADRIASLAPAAARINKRTLRQITRGGPTDAERRAHFVYADSADHREGIGAFIEKRQPRF
jgi:enoyl-CoA hydratase